MLKPFQILLTLLTLSTLGLVAAHSQSSADASGQIRIGVVQDGLYRIMPSDLTSAGVNLGDVDPRTFAMTSMGQPIAIRLTGDSDGSFDGNDVIEFFGEKYMGTDPDPGERDMQKKYTDERTYWLDYGNTPGFRVLDVDASPTGSPTPPLHYSESILAEESNIWFALHKLYPERKDTWFWDALRPTPSNDVNKDFTWTTPYPVATESATLWVDQNARQYNQHHTEISINGVWLADVEWENKNRSYTSSVVPLGTLTGNTSTVSVNAVALPGVNRDWVLFNNWELQYRRLFRAWEGMIDFMAESDGPHEYQIDGWTTSEVAIWDITDSDSVRRLMGATPSPGTLGKALRFRANDLTGDRFWLQTVPSFLAPASIRLRPPTTLRNPIGGADAVIVTSPELHLAAESLATWHLNQGRRVVIAEFPDIIDEFNDGIYHPQAVQTMLAWAQNNWAGAPPRSLTLMGDGHWNFKGYNPSEYPPQPNHIPPYLHFSDPWQGEVPIDGFYGDLDGDKKQDIAVGRLPVNTLAEAQTVVNKIKNYDQSAPSQPWQKRTLFVADDKDSAGDFALLSDMIIADHLPADLSYERIYLTETVVDAASGRTAITENINNGVLLVQFSGHGAPYRWTHELMWHIDYVPDLTNAQQLPLMMTFNCLDGYFVHPNPTVFGMAEVMLRQANGGSIGAISPTGLGITYDQHKFRELLMDIIFKEDVREMGQALLLTKQRFEDEFGYRPNYLLETMSFFGEPMLRLPGEDIVTPTPTARLFLPTIIR